MADSVSRLRLVVDSTGVDKAGRKLKSLRKDAKGADDAARRLASAFAALTAVLGGLSASKMLDAFNEQARSIAKVEQAIRSTAGAAGHTAAELLKVASGLQKITLFGDERILNEVTAQLLTFTNIANEEFKRTQAVALDLATVLDGDLKSASIQLGKALNDPIKNLSALSRSGIQFSESQTALIKSLTETGRLAEAQGVILTELERQYGGQAEAAARVGTGLLTQLQNVVGDISELLGEKLFNTIRPAVDALYSFLTVDENQVTVVRVISDIALALAAIAVPAGLSALAGVIGALLSPLGLLAIAIGAVVAFRDDIAELLFGVRDAGAVLRATFEVLAPIVGAAAAAVGDFARDTVQFLTGAAGAASDFFKGFSEKALSFIPPQALDAIKRFAGLVIDVFATMARTIAELLTDAILLPIRAVEKFYELIAGLELLPQEMRSRLQSAAADFKNFADRIDAVAGGETVDAIGAAAKAAIENIKGVAAGAVEIYDDIKIRAGEIAAAGDALAESPGPVKLRKEVEKLGIAAGGAAAEMTALQRAQQDILDTEEIVRAARLGERQERIAREILSLRRQDKDITLEQARALAEQNVHLEEQLEIIREQRAIIEAPFENLADNLRDAIVNGGKAGVNGLKGVFKSFISDLKTSFLDSLFQPLLYQIRNLTNGISVPIFGPQAGIGGSRTLLQTPTGQSALGGFQLPSLVQGGLFSALSGFTGFSIGSQISDLLGITGSSKSVKAGGAVGGFIGSAFGGPIGAAIGAALGNIVGGLFSKPSNKVGQAVFDPISGRIIGTGQKDNSAGARQNLEIAKAISGGVSDAVGALADLIGSDLAKLINVEVGNRTGITIGLQGSQGQILNSKSFANDEAGAQAAIEAGIRLALQNLQGGNEALRETAKALAASNTPLQEIADTLSNVARLTELAEEPLSEYQQRIKEINEVFADAIESVKGVTKAEQELIQARDRALAKVTTDFNKAIQDDISQYLTGPTDQLEKLLQAQKERLEEAQKLGADLGEVERLSALELRSFFQGLNDQALQEVQSFLGLFEEATNSVVRNLDLSRQDLEGQRDSFAQFAQDFAQLQTDFQERFVAASPRESLDILRARASDLLGQVGEGNVSAAQALPQVLNNLVENARQSFGNTKAFQDVLNFAQGIASQAEQSALQIVSDAERQIAALDESNVLLSDIKDILASSEAANAFFQSYASGGIASADELLALIQQGAGLTVASNDNAAALNITGLIAQSVAPIITPIANSIDTFTQRLSDMPNLMRLHIEATDRGTEAIEDQTRTLEEKQDRSETLLKKILEELEKAA